MLASKSMLGSSLVLVLAAATAAVVADHAACKANSLETSYPAPKAADGWSYRLVANNLTKPRSIVFDRRGGLLVVDSGVGLFHFSFEDNGGTCLSVDRKTTLVENKELTHGLALSQDGRTIYASTQDEVYSWPYDASSPGALSGDDRRTLVANMTNRGGLSTRTLLLSRSEPGLLFVSRGSDSDDDPEAETLSSGRSQIRSFDLGRLDAADSDPYDFLDGRVWGWGLRNAVGLAEDPVHGGLWSVENSVDELRRNGRDIHLDNPAEELNFHGYANGTAGGPLRTTGTANNYGYPYCFAVWSTDIPDADKLRTGDQVPDETTDGVTDATCDADYVAPVLTFQPHMAPLDVKFTKDGSELLVSFHGSYSVEDPVGYKISSVAFGSDGMPTAASDSRRAARDVLTTPDLGNCPDGCFRPVGMAWDSEDRLWFTSDSTGEIFVMERSSSSSGGGKGGDDDESGDEGAAAGRLIQPKVVVALFALTLGLLLA